MKRHFVIAALALLASSVASAQIPLDQVRVIGSDPSVLSFPRTATLHEFGATYDSRRNVGHIRLQTSGAESWPALAIDSSGVPVQSGTLWIFLQINGQWYATGAERLRPNQVNGTKPQGSPRNLIGDGWLYDSGRWGPMAGYNPAPGERIGVMVAAGSTRSDHNVPVAARTNVLMIEWPADTGGDPARIVWREDEGAVVPPGPTPGPAPQPGPSPSPSGLEAVYAQLADLRAYVTEAVERYTQALSDLTGTVQQHAAVLADQSARIVALEARPVLFECEASARLIIFSVPISCRQRPVR